MVINKKFWDNKKVLITGHTGFKGSWLTFWLNRLGAKVKGISLAPDTDPNIFELIINESEIQSTFVDIRNLDLLKKEVVSFDPDIIIHMAAQAIVRESYKDPITTLQTNIIGTANILESARYLENIGAILCITSDKCYENREWHWKYREQDPMGGYDPYSASKGCSELVVASYRKSFFSDPINKIGIASARAGNVIGGGDWSTDRLIPDCIKAFANNEEVIIRSPEAIRPWQFILDLLYGYIILTEKLYNERDKFSEAWNFGPFENDEKPVEYIVKEISELWDKSASWNIINDEEKRPHEATYLKLDSSKSRARLDWAPIFNLKESLSFIIEWYKKFYDGDDMVSITEKQLDRYMNYRSSV